MKLLIDISEEEMDMINNSHKAIFGDVYTMMARKIKDGTPLLDSTNGEVIKALFPDILTTRSRFYMNVSFKDDKFDHCLIFDLNWWNAPYGKE